VKFGALVTGLLLGLLAVLQTAPAAAQPGQAASPNIPSGKPCAGAEYPPEAQRYELEGITILRFHLGPDGRVTEVRVDKSSGWALLDEAAIRTIRACSFTPEQAVRAKGAALPVKYVWSLEGNRVRPQLLPGSCPASGRFAAFQPYENAPSGPEGVKVRLLVSDDGKPRRVKPEGASLPRETLDALVKYVESCRFGFDPSIKGERTDTAYGRVVLAK
jgi:TonB family protein